MLLHTRAPYLELTTGIDTTEIARTSRLVSRLTGYPVQPNKAIVGRNAFAHESGIHQDGVLKERTTYEIMDAKSIGLEANSIVLGKHSGRHALAQALSELGFEVSGQTLNIAFKRFKEIADKKRHLTAMDLEALVTDELREEIPAYQLEWFDVDASSRRPPHATVGVRTPDGEKAVGSFTGDGPIDAIFHAINAATGVDAQLREFRIDAVTAGRTHSARHPSCSRSTESSDPARESRPTSLTLPAAHTSARSRTRYAVSRFRPRAKRRPSRRPRPRPPALRGQTAVEHDWLAELPAAAPPAHLLRSVDGPAMAWTRLGPAYAERRNFLAASPKARFARRAGPCAVAGSSWVSSGLGRGQYGGLAQRERVVAGRHAEHAAVFAAELRGAVVADGVSDAGDVVRVGEESRPCLAQADLLLVLDRRHRRDRAEVAVERRDAHRRELGELIDPQRLVVVDADPADRAGHVGEPAVGQPDLPHGPPLRTGDQPPQDLALDAGRERRRVVGGIEEGEQPAGRVEQRGRRVADGDPGRRGVRGARPGGARRQRL